MSEMDPAKRPFTCPNWARVLLVVSSAIVVFRICKLGTGFIFFWMQGIQFLFPVAYFLHRWDYILVTGFSLVAAVLVSRWIENRFLGKSHRATVVTSIALSCIALLPIEIKIDVKPVMASPLEIAIAQHYSMETVEAIIDRYPRLVNGSVRPSYHFRPLVEAACSGRTNLVELLIQKGANVDDAVRELQQIHAEDAVRLVLDCSETQNTIGATNGSQPIRVKPNRTSSAVGSPR